MIAYLEDEDQSIPALHGSMKCKESGSIPITLATRASIVGVNVIGLMERIYDLSDTTALRQTCEIR